MKVFCIGGSRNIGYYASLRLLEKGETVTFLLRNPSVFDGDTTIQKYVNSGKARIVQGDALIKEDVARGWGVAGKTEESGEEERVDILLFTLGGTPSFVLSKMNFILKPPDLCTRSLCNTLTTLPTQPSPIRIVVVTSTGLSNLAHSTLPLSLRALYTAALRSAHEDKKGAETLLAHCMGTTLDPSAFPPSSILPENWEKDPGMPARGSLGNVVIVRPALLTDGVCRADKKGVGAYRVLAEGDRAVPGGYSVSRRDTAHFVVERVLGGEWEKWAGKGVSMAY